MAIHQESHPLAGQTVKVKFDRKPGPAIGAGEYEATVEDWWDVLTGGSWMFAQGNHAALNYAIGSGLVGLPTDDEVVYVKIEHLGYIVHVSELVTHPLDPDCEGPRDADGQCSCYAKQGKDDR